MPIQFSPIIAALAQGNGGPFSMQSINLHELGVHASPVAVLDQFRVRGRPFAPHPHAGFSAVTYVFEDSETGLQSRNSLGDDLLIGPGGIVWTQAGSGVIHEELPAESGHELHGIQIFVNVSAKNKLTAPQVFRLANSEVPEWHSNAGDRVRVVVGAFDGVLSPLVPAEPFTLLDIELRREVSFGIQRAHNTLIYILEGDVRVGADGHEQQVIGEHALALYGSGGLVTLQAIQQAHLLILSGAEIREPVLVQGPFIMNDQSQLEDAVARYRRGAMGHLEPLSEN